MVSKSPKRFLERAGIVKTLRLPAPVVNFSRLAILDDPSGRTERLVELQFPVNGSPPPDRAGRTKKWPEGN